MRPFDEHISDEKLSAFLDSELPEKEMEMIRELLATDETLVNRIAEMASVDAIVSSTYHQIDEEPLPHSIQQLLDSADHSPSGIAASVSAKSTSNVTSFPLWRRFGQAIQQHASYATAAALVIGMGVGYSLLGINSQGNPDWDAVAQVLNHTPSGDSITLNEQFIVTPRVSFTNTEGQFCRQFVMVDSSQQHNNIACHTPQGWQLHATVYTTPQADSSYQTATSDQTINAMVDAMANGPFLNREQEQEAITHDWSN